MEDKPIKNNTTTLKINPPGLDLELSLPRRGVRALPPFYPPRLRALSAPENRIASLPRSLLAARASRPRLPPPPCPRRRLRL